jgi:hypothetical protein
MEVLNIYRAIFNNAIAYNLGSERIRTLCGVVSLIAVVTIIVRVFTSTHQSWVGGMVTAAELVLVAWCSAMLVPLMRQMQAPDTRLFPGLRARIVLIAVILTIAVAGMLLHFFGLHKFRHPVNVTGFLLAFAAILIALAWTMRSLGGDRDTANPLDALSYQCARGLFERSLRRATRAGAPVHERIAAAMGWRLHWASTFGLLLVMTVLLVLVMVPFEGGASAPHSNDLTYALLLMSFVWGYFLACRVSGQALASEEERRVLALVPGMPLASGMAVPVARVLGAAFLKCCAVLALFSTLVSALAYWHRDLLGLVWFFLCQAAYVGAVMGYARPGSGRGRYLIFLLLPLSLVIAVWFGEHYLPQKYVTGAFFLPAVVAGVLLYRSWSGLHDETGKAID